MASWLSLDGPDRRRNQNRLIPKAPAHDHSGSHDRLSPIPRRSRRAGDVLQLDLPAVDAREFRIDRPRA